jgi:hypothetical protein
MVSKSKDFTSREVQGAALLKIHHMTAKMMTDVRPDMSDMRAVFEAVKVEKFLEYLDDFQTIINLSRLLIVAAEQNAKNGKPPLTFSSDLGLIGPLYYVCINCPTVIIRTTAMELLLRCPRREGMWNSVLIAQMIQQYWELEARHKEAQDMGMEVDEFGFPVPFSDRGSVHFAFFGRPTEMNTTGVSHFPPAEVAPPELVSSPPSLGLRSNPATHGDKPRQDPEAEALAVLERAIAQEQEWQPLAENLRETRQSVNSFLPLKRDDGRVGTQMDLDRIIANGLTNILEGPSPEGQAVENIDELVASYWDFVRIDDVDLTAA